MLDRRDCVGVGLALAALLAMTAWSWGRLVEIQYDFGREVYIPWQLALGRRLHVDLVYYYGPLSPYLNALVFRLLGSGVQILMGINLIIVLLILILLYYINRIISDVGGDPGLLNGGCKSRRRREIGH
jgi:hypothetical protein